MSDWGSTSRISARVTLADGAVLEGELHLASRPSYPPGPETPIEMLNRADPFFALIPREGGVVFLPKAGVVGGRLSRAESLDRSRPGHRGQAARARGGAAQRAGVPGPRGGRAAPFALPGARLRERRGPLLRPLGRRDRPLLQQVARPLHPASTTEIRRGTTRSLHPGHARAARRRRSSSPSASRPRWWPTAPSAPVTKDALTDAPDPRAAAGDRRARPPGLGGGGAGRLLLPGADRRGAGGARAGPGGPARGGPPGRGRRRSGRAARRRPPRRARIWPRPVPPMEALFRRPGGLRRLRPPPPLGRAAAAAPARRAGPGGAGGDPGRAPGDDAARHHDAQGDRRIQGRGDTDWAYEIEGLARFRCNAARDRHGPMAVFRIIPTTVRDRGRDGAEPRGAEPLLPHQGSGGGHRPDRARARARRSPRWWTWSTAPAPTTSSRSRTRSSSCTRARSAW